MPHYDNFVCQMFQAPVAAHEPPVEAERPPGFLKDSETQTDVSWTELEHNVQLMTALFSAPLASCTPAFLG
jgi:hypothetical protein